MTLFHVQKVHFPQGRLRQPPALFRENLGRLGGEGGHRLALVTRHRHDHLVCDETPVPSGDDKEASAPFRPIHLDAMPDRQLEAFRVGFEVVGHLVLGRK